MPSIKEMLEAKQEASEQFTEDNFGLKVGDGFRELVLEFAASEKLAPMLVMNLAFGALLGKEVISDIPKEKGASWAPAIIKHLAVFEQPLSLLYWGIQVGRKLEREEQEALKRMGGE